MNVLKTERKPDFLLSTCLAISVFKQEMQEKGYKQSKNSQSGGWYHIFIIMVIIVEAASFQLTILAVFKV